MEQDDRIAYLFELYRKHVDGEGGKSLEEVIQLTENKQQQSELMELINSLTFIDAICDLVGNSQFLD